MNQSLLYDVDAVMPLAVATGLFVSLCTFQAPDGTLGASGAPSGTYTPVAGLVNIVCMDAPQPTSELKVGAQESRQPGQITDSKPRHILLDAYYPMVEAGWRNGWRAVVTTTRNGVTDTFTYDICGSEPDSQRTQTRLELKLATAGAVQS